jgi:hypothetical protein
MVAIGTLLACATEKYSAKASVIELAAGFLIVAGLVLIGISVDAASRPWSFRF